MAQPLGLTVELDRLAVIRGHHSSALLVADTQGIARACVIFGHGGQKPYGLLTVGGGPHSVEQAPAKAIGSLGHRGRRGGNALGGMLQDCAVAGHSGGGIGGQAVALEETLSQILQGVGPHDIGNGDGHVLGPIRRNGRGLHSIIKGLGLGAQGGIVIAQPLLMDTEGTAVPMQGPAVLPHTLTESGFTAKTKVKGSLSAAGLFGDPLGTLDLVCEYPRQIVPRLGVSHKDGLGQIQKGLTAVDGIGEIHRPKGRYTVKDLSTGANIGLYTIPAAQTQGIGAALGFQAGTFQSSEVDLVGLGRLRGAVPLTAEGISQPKEGFYPTAIQSFSSLQEPHGSGDIGGGTMTMVQALGHSDQSIRTAPRCAVRIGSPGVDTGQLRAAPIAFILGHGERTEGQGHLCVDGMIGGISHGDAAGIFPRFGQGDPGPLCLQVEAQGFVLCRGGVGGQESVSIQIAQHNEGANVVDLGGLSEKGGRLGHAGGRGGGRQIDRAVIPCLADTVEGTVAQHIQGTARRLTRGKGIGGQTILLREVGHPSGVSGAGSPQLHRVGEPGHGGHLVLRQTAPLHVAETELVGGLQATTLRRATQVEDLLPLVHGYAPLQAVAEVEGVGRLGHAHIGRLLVQSRGAGMVNDRRAVCSLSVAGHDGMAAFGEGTVHRGGDQFGE